MASSSSRGEMEKMGIDQLKALKEQADLEVNLLQNSLNNIRTATVRLDAAAAALNDLSPLIGDVTTTAAARWHDAGTYDAKKKTGGPNGSIRFKEELNRPHNKGLEKAVAFLWYMPMMELGVSSDMFDIKKNALKNLSKQQSSYRIKLLSSYKEMVAVVVEMVNASRSLRSYTKLGTESLVQFSCSKEDSTVLFGQNLKRRKLIATLAAK
ncbi:unnamed protein product [Arabidopsis arenosa]|uniref:Uncharacterized protein n=1 Tax=Arabidopsis arenosa TaxID=38785 RepID=A0A8S2A8V7_ARAAE|nr:unnamed protein product [Arabidopsis arenosa]